MLRNDISYHRWRAASEARAAERSRDARVGQVHHHLAALHADRVVELEREGIDRAERLRRIMADCINRATRRLTSDVAG